MNTMKKNIASASSSEAEARDVCQVLEHEIVDIVQVPSSTSPGALESLRLVLKQVLDFELPP